MPQQNASHKIRLIILLGPTGSGKSTFISLAVGSESGHLPKIGRGLTSMTASVSEYQVNDARAAITLVDTPGFDSAELPSDEEIWESILSWAREKNRDNKKTNIELCGIIYLIDPGYLRRRSKALFHDMSPLPVLFGFSYWMNPPKAASRRDLEQDFRAQMPSHHSIMPFEDRTTECVWKIIQSTLDTKSPIPLAVFIKFVEEHLSKHGRRRNHSSLRFFRSIFRFLIV
ncbi:hypothetical protein BJ912DRAFT_969861 [Pholiota molesta]|nr:hypothetical protein BJ912DRAFT_969861 [Pholiota molesta]